MSDPKKKSKVNNKHHAEENPFLYTVNVAMATECTGMIPTPADEESYQDMLED